MTTSSFYLSFQKQGAEENHKKKAPGNTCYLSWQWDIDFWYKQIRIDYGCWSIALQLYEIQDYVLKLALLFSDWIQQSSFVSPKWWSQQRI